MVLNSYIRTFSFVNKYSHSDSLVIRYNYLCILKLLECERI